MIKDIWKIYRSKYSREKCKMLMKQKKKNDIKTKLLFLILAVIEVHRFFLLF